jgi:diketogulonate reductase-like aldo/keto reductase
VLPPLSCMSTFMPFASMCQLIVHPRSFSGVKHLEEIRNAGLEMPSVNQIEVCDCTASYLHGLIVSLSCLTHQLHPLCQQRPIVSYCREHSIVVQAYCPIIRGKIDHEVIKAVAAKVSVPLLLVVLDTQDGDF